MKAEFRAKYPLPPEFRSDGCTGAPDNVFGLDLTPACRLHDFLRRYAVVSVRDADRLFHRALRFLGCPRWLARLYWLGVKISRPWFTRTEVLPAGWSRYATYYRAMVDAHDG